MKIVDQLSKFSGKRNAVITLMVPPGADFEQMLTKIEKRVSAMKHKNKRSQVMKVLSYIRDENDGIKNFNGNGRIICCGFNFRRNPVYHLIEPPNKIQAGEYHYGYQFNIERIQEIFNADIIFYLKEEDEEKEVNRLINKIKNEVKKQTAIGDREIIMAVDCDLIDTIYYSGKGELDEDFIEGLRRCKGKVVKIRNRDLMKNYGEMIGLLKYPIDFELIDEAQ